MPLAFGNRGYLQPPDRYELSIEEFKQYFVDAFPRSQTRSTLFDGFVRYTQLFRSTVTPDFIQWIGGSYTTQKLNPRDIDVLTIIAHQTYQNKEATIDSQFRRGSKQDFGVDAYIIASYPETHPKYPLYRGNLVYWDNQFSRTRKNRAGKRFSRGYVQILHQKIAI